MNVYQSEYDDSILYVSDFKEGSIGYVHVYNEDKEKMQWYECVVKSVRELPGGNSDFEGEFVTDNDTYYVGLDVVKELDERPDIYVTHYC